jgi:hypothetical protein
MQRRRRWIKERRAAARSFGACAVAYALVIGGGAGLATELWAQPGPCKGEAIVNVTPQGDVVEDLVCTGRCRVKGTTVMAPCRPRTDSATGRRYCGCPQDREPEDCHVALVGRTAGGWDVECAGTCPRADQTCLPMRRMINQIRDGIMCMCLP